MMIADYRRRRAAVCQESWRLIALAWLTAIVILAPTIVRAQNLTDGELKLGILDHDVHFAGGKEHGVDINPEVIFPSPISDAWIASLPGYIRWALQPRGTIGAEFNTSKYTNDYYFGATWSWLLVSNILRPDDGLTFGIFFGPGFNDGDLRTSNPSRKSLGSNVLFREAFELGYRITPVYQVSAFFDHVSNAGLAKENQSLNDAGIRFGIRF
jgi:lipid A 3-O-deacylase